MTGRILRAGLAALALAAPALAQDAALNEGHLAVLDIDRDGSVSKAEYRIVMSNAFVLLDTDHDNELARGDFADTLTDAQFVQIDADGDGTASRAEFDAQVLRDFDTADGSGNGSLE